MAGVVALRSTITLIIFCAYTSSPQVPGIGPKIAAGLINEFGTLSNLIEQAHTIKQKKRRESLMENADKVSDDHEFTYSNSARCDTNTLL